MKFRIKSILTGLFLLFLSASSFSQENDEGFYLGVRLGKMFFDGDTFNNAISKGGVVGYTWSNFGVELERRHAKADWDFETSFGAVGGSHDIDTTAFYGAFRTSGSVYFKGKIGWQREDVEDEDGDSESDSGFSFGVGIGTRIDNVQIEAEYTTLEEDKFLLGLGVNYIF